MAGYITKPQGHIYEGELTNGLSTAVGNGTLLVLGTGENKGKLVAPAAADTTSKFVLREVTTIYNGTTAYRFIADTLSANYYFVECNFDINDSEAYDETAYTTPAGGLLRAHPLVVGEEFVTTVITGTLTEGTAYGVKTDGSIG